MPKPIPTQSYPFLAREGRPHIFIALLLAALATWTVGWWSIPAWLAFAFICQFFRDPKRRITDQLSAVVSPASGKIVALEECENPYLPNPTPKSPAPPDKPKPLRSLKISIFMNVFNVHSNLIPISGTIRERWYHPGRFLNAALDKASTANERNAIWIKTNNDTDIICTQIAGLIARRISCDVAPGDTVHTGQRYGFIRFGSRVDLYLPPTARAAVKLGQRVNSGNDIIAHL